MLGGCTWAQSALILNGLELPAEGVRVIQTSEFASRHFIVRHYNPRPQPMIVCVRHH
jgi:hypothetical protein